MRMVFFVCHRKTLQYISGLLLRIGPQPPIICSLSLDVIESELVLFLIASIYQVCRFGKRIAISIL